MSRRLLVLGTVAALYTMAPSPARTQVASHGFSIRDEARISASPAKTYKALVKQVGLWWGPEHTYSGDSRNLSIDTRPGGCFCEKLPKGGAIEHMRVIYVVPGELLRMSGALGPLQESGIVGTLTFSLKSAADGTAVEMSYIAGGFMEGGFEAIAPAVGTVLGDQLQRLKLFVETGRPVPQAP